MGRRTGRGGRRPNDYAMMPTEERVKEIFSKSDNQSRHTGTWMNMQFDKGSNWFSDRDKRECSIIGVPTRRLDGRVKSDEAASRKTGRHLAGEYRSTSVKIMQVDGQTKQQPRKKEKKLQKEKFKSSAGKTIKFMFNFLFYFYFYVQKWPPLQSQSQCVSISLLTDSP